MRNASGYITEDGRFFEDKKEAERHEKMLSMGKHIDDFLRLHYNAKAHPAEAIKAWEKYKMEIMK